MREEALMGGGDKRIAAQHGRGKLLARERINLLLDEGSFEELDILKAGRGGDGHDKKSYPGDGVVTGHGTINGREVFVFSQDFTVIGGSLGEGHSQKICKVMDLASRVGSPIIGLNDPPERTDPTLDYLVPPNPNQSYDMNVLIYSILDGAEFLEVQAHYARNIICGFGRLGGQTIGLVANQPAVLAGVLDNNASSKAARFVRFCDTFNPVPGEQEKLAAQSSARQHSFVRLIHVF